MSYSVYQYPPSGSSYDSYSQQYETQPYGGGDAQGQYAQYDYTSSQSLDQYAQPTASVPTDYSGYSSITDTGYASTSVTSYPDSSISHTPYHYEQDSGKIDQFAPRPSLPSDSIPGPFSAPVTQYSSVTTTHDPVSAQSVSDYNTYKYQSTDYNQLPSSYGQDSTPSRYTESYNNQNISEYSYHDEPSQPTSTWTSGDQYTSYNAGYYEESPARTSYLPKEESGFGSADYSPSVDRYSQSSSIGHSEDYSLPDPYSGTHDSGSAYQGYVKPTSTQEAKPHRDFSGYSAPSQFNRGSENISSSVVRNYSSDRGGSLGETSSVSSNYYGSGRGRGGVRGNFQGGTRGNFTSRMNSNRFTTGQTSNRFTTLQNSNRFTTGQNSNRFTAGQNNNRFTTGQKNTYPTQTSTAPRSFNSQSNSGGSSFSARNFSSRGARGGTFASRGSFTSSNSGDRRGNVSKPPIVTVDARNKINEARSAVSAAPSKVTPAVPLSNKNKTQVPPIKQPESNSKKEIFKAPSRPQDRLLNEIAEKEKAQRAEELKKSEEEQKKAEEKRLKDLEEEKKRAEEELRKKVAEEAVKAAPPSKPPETAEEIAHEEEIQRKIRESVVIISPEQETALMKDDPSKDVEMPEELRTLLKTLTTDYLCKLCSVRIVGPQMAAMHYNGKNHLKKLRNFAQTNGRSAGFNLETLEKSGNGEQKEAGAGEKKAEVVEITDIDQKKYCKVCKVSFSQESQADIHYKGKNHAKRIKSIGNGPEVFECKICCVTVTAQEHLTAHLNGARHKLQVRKMDTNESFRGGVRGRGRGVGFRGRGRGGRAPEGEWRPLPETGNRGRGFRGRGHPGSDFPFRGQGFKRRGGFDEELPFRDGPTFPKRPRF